MAGATKARKKRGRPTLPPGEVKRAPLNMRTTPKLRKRIDKSAAESGSSLAQEIEARLSRSYLFEDTLSVMGAAPETARFIRNLLDAQQLIEQKSGHAAWGDYETWIALKAAVIEIFEIERPSENRSFKEKTKKSDKARKRILKEWCKRHGAIGVLSTGDAPPPNYPLSPKAQAEAVGKGVAEVLMRNKIEALENLIKEHEQEMSRQELAAALASVEDELNYGT